MTNTIPAGLHALILLFVWLVIGARSVLLRFNTIDVRLTQSLAFACLALTLKDPTVASVVVPAIGAPLTRTLVHILILCAIAALVGVYNAWDPAEEDWKQPTLYVVALGIGAVMLVLSAPARAAGVTVEQAGGWQAIAYFAAYALFNLYGLGSVAFVYLRNWRTNRTWKSRLTIGCVVAFLVSMLVESLSMAVSATLAVMDTGEALTEAKQSTNGWLYAVMMVVAVALSGIPLLSPSTWSSFADRARIHRFWDQLAAATPEVVLGGPRDRRALSEDQRGIRLVTESYDSLRILERYSEPITDGRWDDDLQDLTPGERAAVYRAAQLQNAIEARRSGKAPLSMTSEVGVAPADPEEMLAEIAELARQWPRARRLREAALAR